MNAHDEMDLGAILRGRAAEGDAGVGLGLADVRKKAGQIRRRRAMTAGAGVAAGLAILVPTAMFGGGLIGDDATSENPPPAKETTASTETGAPAEGRAPTQAWIDNSRRLLITGDGDEIPLQHDGYGQVAKISNQIFAMRNDNGNGLLDIYVDGTLTESIPTTLGFALSLDGQVIAWSTREGELFAQYEGSPSWEGDRISFGNQGGPVTPVAVSSNGSCKETDVVGDDEVGGCLIYFNREGEAGPGVENTHGNAEMPSGLVDIAALDPVAGLLAAQTDREPPGDPYSGKSCHALIGQYTFEPVRESCDLWFQEFSTVGTHLLAVDSDSDGAGPGRAYLVETATGEKVATFEGHGTILDMAWEGNSHVLFSTHEDGQWRILRFGLDGSLETAAGPVAGDIFDNPFVLTDRAN